MINLDDLIHRARRGQRIELKAGRVYFTRGCPQDGALGHPVLKKGCAIHGNMAVVRVLPVTTKASIDGLFGEGSNQVQDIVLDIDSSAAVPTRKINGIAMNSGERNRVSNCRLIGINGFGVNHKECFGIVSKGTEDTVENCSIHSPVGDYISAISCLSGHITGCAVYWPPLPAERVFWQAYNVQNCDSLVVEKCESFGGVGGIYSDWKNTSNLLVRQCRFIGVRHGLHLNAQEISGQREKRTVRGVRFEGNTVLLRRKDSVGVAAVLLDHTWSIHSEEPNHINSIRDVQIKGNEFRFDSQDGPSPSAAYVANIATNCPQSGPERGIWEVLIQGNNADPKLRFRNKGTRAQVTAPGVDRWITQ